MLSHGKLDLSYFFGGAENCVDLLHISVAEIAEEIIKHQACVNTVFVHKLKQEGIEIALLVSHWLIFLTNQQTKFLAPNYNPK